MRVAWFSLFTLRKYNPDIQVEILYICDNKRENRFLGRLERLDLGVPWFNRDLFFRECKKFNVSLNVIQNLDMGEEEGFHSAQRQAFQYVKGQEILLIDADTFIFSDISVLFKELKYNDIVIDQNEWGSSGYRFPFLGKQHSPFNSGVVLFGQGLLQEYGAKVYDLCLAVKHETHPVGVWLGEYEENQNVLIPKLSREEFALTIFILENNLKYRLFRSDEVQTSKYRCRTRIYHTTTQYWPAAWQKFFRKGQFCPPFNYRPKFCTISNKYFHEKEKEKDGNVSEQNFAHAVP